MQQHAEMKLHFPFSAGFFQTHFREKTGSPKKRILLPVILLTIPSFFIRQSSAQEILRIIGPKYSVLFAAKDPDGQDLLKELPPPLTESSPAYPALSKKGSAAHLAGRIDGILKRMKKDGTYDRIMRKYLY